MSREIKFRAWTGARMLFKTLDDNNWYDSIETHATPICAKSTSDVRKFEVMQFTGLKDKNGKEIYESDLLRVDWDKSKILLVSWDEKMAAFQAASPKDPVDVDFFNWGRLGSVNTKDVPTFHAGMMDGNVEVIGNIYENGDLLK